MLTSEVKHGRHFVKRDKNTVIFQQFIALELFYVYLVLRLLLYTGENNTANQGLQYNINGEKDTCISFIGEFT